MAEPTRRLQSTDIAKQSALAGAFLALLMSLIDFMGETEYSLGEFLVKVIILFCMFFIGFFLTIALVQWTKPK